VPPTTRRTELAAVTAITRAVIRRPDLWSVALRQVMRLARPQWWRTRPYLPLPPTDYLHFRLVTAYGGDGGVPESALAGGSSDLPSVGDDVVAYLQWCREWRAAATSGPPIG